MTYMTEKQIIAKIRQLKQIKPREDWVYFTKQRILEEKETEFSFSFVSFLKELQRGERFVFRHKPAFAFLTILVVLIGVFGFVQNSVPGDSLFALKKIAEKGTAVFIAEKNQPKHNLEVVNKRLDDLTKIAVENEVNNLAPAINEYQKSISKVVESLSKAENSDIIREIADIVKELEQKEERVKSLGIEIGEDGELSNILANIVETEIKDLENRTLSQEQEQALNEIKQDYEAGSYSEALEKILILTY